MTFHDSTKFVSVIPISIWNRFLYRFARNRPLRVKVDQQKHFLHPWKVSSSWDPEREEWTFQIHPGFVNAQEVIARVPVGLTSEATATRLADPEEDRVDAWLSESPRIPASPDLWRAIGTDDVAGDAETVPEYFLNLGVELPKRKTEVRGSQIVTQIRGEVVPVKEPRLLRAIDIVLLQPRPSIKVDWQETPDGVQSIVNVQPSSGPPQIVLRKQQIPRVEGEESIEQIAAGLIDDGLDEIHLATVYLVSRPGETFGATPDATWSPHVKHRVFWNLSHAIDRDLVTLSPDPLVFSTFGLAGGVGEPIVQGLLRGLNDADAQVRSLINRSRIRGQFWSV